MTELDKLMAEVREHTKETYVFGSELDKRVGEELLKSMEALHQLGILIKLDAAATIPLSDVAYMFDTPVDNIRWLANTYADELESDGYTEGHFTRRSIYRLAMFLPSDKYLVDTINRYILNVAATA